MKGRASTNVINRPADRASSVITVTNVKTATGIAVST